MLDPVYGILRKWHDLYVLRYPDPSVPRSLTPSAIDGFSGCTKYRDGLNLEQYENCIKARATFIFKQFLLALT